MMRKLIAVLLGIFLCNEATLGESPNVYVGFDRNDYPGDSSLPALRKNFRYTSYWLNNPPGEKQNSWTGKRSLLKQQGFGFLVLFNGRLDAELKGKDAAALGAVDGKSAVTEAATEGFRSNIVISWIKKRVDGFFPNKSLIFLPGSTRSAVEETELESIVRVLRCRTGVARSAQPKTWSHKRRHGRG